MSSSSYLQVAVGDEMLHEDLAATARRIGRLEGDDALVALGERLQAAVDAELESVGIAREIISHARHLARVE